MKNTDFSHFVGIDVAKDKFNYAVIDNSMHILREGQFSMNAEGFTDFLVVVKGYPHSVFALESTGSYHVNLLAFLTANDKKVALINPVLIKKFMQTLTLRKTKTDKIDAVVIAKFIFKNIEHVNRFVPDSTDDITALARARESVTKQLARIKTQLKQHLAVVFPELTANCNVFTDFILNVLEVFPTPQSVVNSPDNKVKAVFDRLMTGRGRRPALSYQRFIKIAKTSIGFSSDNYALIVRHDVRMIKFLDKQLEEITETFIDEIRKNREDELEIIKSIKGISDVTSAHFLAEIKDVKRFENKRKLAAYAGIDPSVRQSGYMYANGRISRRGSKSLRRCLYLMASGLVRCNEYFRAYYLKKKKEGMPHRKAMIALCNKLVRVLFALLKKHEKFNPRFHYL